MADRTIDGNWKDGLRKKAEATAKRSTMRLLCRSSGRFLDTLTMLPALLLPKRKDGHQFLVGVMVGTRHFPGAYRGGAAPRWEKTLRETVAAQWEELWR